MRAMAEGAIASAGGLIGWFGSKEQLLLRCGLDFARRYQVALATVPAAHLGSTAFSTSDLIRLRFVWAQVGRRGAELTAVSRALLAAETAVIPGFVHRAVLIRCWEMAQLGAEEAASAESVWSALLAGEPLPE